VTKLSQIIAVTKAVTSTTERAITELHRDTQKTQKEGPLNGISRTYQPDDREGEQFPPESTRVQINVEDLVSRAATVLPGCSISLSPETSRTPRLKQMS
jgi:hypothetical protein